METLYGHSAAKGIAEGTVRVIKHSRERGGASERRSPLSAQGEAERLRTALREADGELVDLKRRAMETVGEAEAEIFEIHRMMMQDDDFIDRVTDAILGKGMCAEDAVLRSGEELATVFLGMDTEYMRARAADIRSVASRLADILGGGNQISYDLASPCIIASDDLTPAETICLDKAKVLGIVTEQGSGSSHTAILARSMGIPAVVGVEEISPAWEGRHCILDGTEGVMYVDPDESAMELLRERFAIQNERISRAEAMRGVALRGKNGAPVRICANAADLSDVDAAFAQDAEGIGLFRSEFLFMQYGRAPTEEEQLEAYRAAAVKMGDRECVIRTLDAGADKQIPYLNTEAEANPALGLRAVRLCLREPSILRIQFRALYRAAAFGNLSAMVPMVVLPSEMEQVRTIATRARQSLIEEEIPVGPLKLGMMIETPASALCADVFAGLADFFSIGTNDLIQYTLAADRENGAVNYLAEPLPESVIRLIRMTCAAAEEKGIPVGVCGELAGDERYIGLLLDCGVTKLSVSPPSVLNVRYAAKQHLNGAGALSSAGTLSGITT